MYVTMVILLACGAACRFTYEAATTDNNSRNLLKMVWSAAEIFMLVALGNM